MKRIVMLAMLMAGALGAFAGGATEGPKGVEPVTLRVFGNFPPNKAIEGWNFTQFDIAEALVARKYPGTKIEYTNVDLSTGADKTMRAAVAAGNTPDLYMDTWVRAASYLRTDFALDLKPYMPDLADYLPGVLETVTRDGELLGLPFPGDGQAMAVNMEMVRDVGFAPADWDTWTIDEFYKLAELVKVKYGGKKWATGLFAANQSGDYLICNWVASFGGKFYGEGDYTKTVINSPQTRAALDFLRDLTAKGFVRADWIGQTDDDYVMDWANGKIATAPFYFGWIEPYFLDVEKSGGKRFEYQFVPFPRGPGVDKVPAYYTTSGGVVPEGKDATRNAIAAYFLWAFNSPESQVVTFYVGNVRPNRRSVTDRIFKPSQYFEVQQVVIANGVLDLGGTSPLYAATRPLFPAMLQRLMQPPKGAANWMATCLAEYEKSMNEILSGK